VAAKDGRAGAALPAGLEGTYQNDARGAQLWIADSFAAADLYWVSPEMCDVLISRPPPSLTVFPQPPVEQAFVVFAKSIPGTDAESGDNISPRRSCGSGRVTRGQSLSIETYAWRDLVIVQQPAEKLQARWRELMPTRLSLQWLGVAIQAMIPTSPLGDDRTPS